jgi:7,8-dihydropterin-6-yl-methyl-4-(beta-D-ribofuranosyl)aminobenzene 5'-phosphate synthase
MHIAHANPSHPSNRGPNTTELRMDNICCSAHGLSLMITATKGDAKHTILFDTGPEESAWERNVSRLRPDLSKIELVSPPILSDHASAPASFLSSGIDALHSILTSI